jgi:hypothetical protein
MSARGLKHYRVRIVIEEECSDGTWQERRVQPARPEFTAYIGGNRDMALTVAEKLAKGPEPDYAADDLAFDAARERSMGRGRGRD